MGLGGFKDAIDKAVDEAEDRVQGATGIDFGGSGGGKNADDVTDKNEDTSQGVTDNPNKAVNEAKEGVGQAVDQAEDTVQETTGQDFGGSGGGSSDTDTETTESSFDSEGGSGGESPEPQPKSQNKGQNRDKAPQTQEQLRKFLGLGKKKTRNAARKINEAINQSEARDRDIINDNFARSGEARLLERSGERALSYATGFQGESFNSRKFNNSMRAENFFTGQSRINQAQDKIEQINNKIETVRSSDSESFIIDTNGEKKGGKKKVSKSKALENLQSSKESLQKNIQTISKNQVKRLQNIQTVQDRIQKDKDTITGKEAEKIAKSKDLSKKKTELTLLGQKTGLKFSGAVNEAGMIFDAFSSGGGASADLIGASVDQFLGTPKNDKTVETVAEKEAIKESQQLKKKGFKPVNEFSEGLTSIPGILGSSLVGGAAFSGGSKAVAALPKVGSAAQKVYQGAGALAGAYTVAKQGQKVNKQLQAGKEGQAVSTVSETATGFYGFYKGQKAFNTYLGARRGTTDISQKNFLRQTGKDSAQGFGRFKGRTVIEKPTVKDYVGKAFGKGFRPKTEVVKSKGRYRIPTASKGSSQAKGRIRLEYPSGSSKTQGFEVLSNVKKTGTTRQGNKFRITSDNVRFKSEGRLFQKFRDQTELTKSIKQSETSAKPREVLNQFKELGGLSKDSNIKKVRLSGTNSESSSFSETTNYLVQKRSGGGSSSSSSGGVGLKTGSKSGGAGAFRVRARDSVNTRVQNYVNRQNPGKIGSSGSSGVVSGTDTQASSGGSGQKQAGNQANTFNVGLSSSQLQNFRQNVYGSRTIQPVKGNGGQKTRDSGTQIRSNAGEGSTGSAEVTSTASNIIQDKKDRLGVGSSDKTGQTPEVGQKPRVGVTPAQGQNQGQRNRQDLRDRIGLGQTGKVGQRLKIGNTAKQGLSQIQSLKPKQIQKLQQKQIQALQPVTTASTTAIPRLGFGGVPTLQLGGGRTSSNPATPETGPKASTVGGIKTDWFSANLVEQKTDEQAKFDLSATPKNQLFGLKTTQERTGKVEPNKILNGNQENGGKEIW